MTATGHAIVGAALVAKIPDLRISLPLALISHFIGDLPDHWDAGNNWRVKGMKKVFLGAAIDLTLSYIAVAAIFIGWLHFDPRSILLGAFVAQIPDFLEIPYFFLHWHDIPWKWVNDFQMIFHKKLPAFNLDITNQIILCLAFVLLSAVK